MRIATRSFSESSPAGEKLSARSSTGSASFAMVSSSLSFLKIVRFSAAAQPISRLAASSTLAIFLNFMLLETSFTFHPLQGAYHYFHLCEPSGSAFPFSPHILDV